MGVSAWGQQFAAASEPHWDALLRFAVRLGLSREESRDVLQNALIRGMKYFESFATGQLGLASPDEVPAALRLDGAGARRFRGWLFTVVRNAAYDFHGAKGKRELFLEAEEWKEIASEGTAGFPGESSEAVGPHPSAAEVERQAQAMFLKAADDTLLASLETLNPKQKSILYLVAEEHTYAEIASILGIPIGTVMSGLSRALKKIKAHLDVDASPGSRE